MLPEADISSNSQEALLEPDTACQRQEEWFKHLDVNNLMPLGVDDEFIFEDVVLPQPENRAPIIVGLIVLSRIFYLAVPGYIPNTDEIGAIRPVFPSIVLEEADKTTAIEKWSILEARLQRLKYALDDVCEELSPWTTASETEFRSFIPNQSIRSRQFEIMRANIQVSHLWLQSTTLEEMITLSTMKTLETVPGNAPEAMQALWNEREDICRQLLHILYNISHDNLEPNGASLVSQSHFYLFILNFLFSHLCYICYAYVHTYIRISYPFSTSIPLPPSPFTESQTKPNIKIKIK